MSDIESDPPPPTLRLCEACGGHNDECIWCTNGYQTIAQRQAWHEYRVQIRGVSGTHMLLREVIEDIIKQLDIIGDDSSVKMVADGRKILYKWLNADPDDTGYELITRQLSLFSREALEVIAKFKHLDHQ